MGRWRCLAFFLFFKRRGTPMNGTCSTLLASLSFRPAKFFFPSLVQNRSTFPLTCSPPSSLWTRFEDPSSLFFLLEINFPAWTENFFLLIKQDTFPFPLPPTGERGRVPPPSEPLLPLFSTFRRWLSPPPVRRCSTLFFFGRGPASRGPFSWSPLFPPPS